MERCLIVTSVKSSSGRRLYIIWLIIVIKLHTFMQDIPSIQKLQFEIIYQIFTSLSV